jgi:fructokinase
MVNRKGASTHKTRFNLRGRPLVVGEVLFDVMPNGNRILGGAPFNVAWHLQAFGLKPLLITRVGDDDAGGEVVAAMESWGMDCSGVQRDETLPTGRVEVELHGGEPAFHIHPNQAWDRLDGGLAKRAAAGPDYSLMYHGSLIARDGVSRSALAVLREATALPVIMDVNLRDPWWARSEVLDMVGGARWVKLNQDELAELAGAADLDSAERFRDRHTLDAVIVTRGEQGAAVIGRERTREAAPPASIAVVDTVGAGDAFSAVYLLGLMKGWSTSTTLERALEFAAAICTRPGATTTDRRLYSDFRHQGRWNT